MIDITLAQTPGLLRRLAAISYDLLLVAAVVVFAAFVYTVVVQGLTGTDLTQGTARLAFRLYLVAIILAYYLYFWTGGRQSLSMRSWRILLVNADGSPLRLGDALRRLGFAVLTLAPLGLGLWWVLLDRDNLSWYDRLAGTRTVLLRKPGKHQRGSEENR
jgi:uncharacterized RDD family membrane protein YckC